MWRRVLPIAMTIALASAAAQTAASAPVRTGGPTSDPVAAAKAAVAKAEAPVRKWTGPTTGPRVAKHKHIYVINCSTQAEGCLRLDAAAMQAIKTIGWTGTLIKTDGSVSQYSAAVQLAISRKADGIVLDSVPPSVVPQALAAAKSAHIPVVSNLTGDRPPKLNFRHFSGGWFTEVDTDNTRMGELAAYWAVVATNGKAQVGTFFTPDYPLLVTRLNGFRSVIARCPSCKLYPPVNVPVTNWGTDAPNAVASFLRANPSINYWFSTADAPVQLEAQGIRIAGVNVPIVSTEGNAPNVAMIRAGGPEVAVAASPLEWSAWASIDQLNRVFNHTAPNRRWIPGGGGVPLKLIVKKNAPSAGTWSGDLNYRLKFKKLWHLTK